MEQAVLGVIGGSGVYDIESLQDVKEVQLKTPFGDPSDAYIVGTLEGMRVAFLPRHGRGHRIMPAELNSRANIWGMKMLGVKYIVSVSAVGSLREDYAPRDIVIPDQLFDRTKARPSTFFGNGLVVHVSFDRPFCPDLSELLHQAAKKTDATVHQGGAMVVIEGPQFSTKAESNIYRQWGLDIIGMTALPEAKLAREAEICYAAMAHVTDYDVWHESEEPVTLQMIIENLQANADRAKAALAHLVPLLAAWEGKQCQCVTALSTAITTRQDLIPEQVKKDLGLLLDKYLK